MPSVPDKARLRWLSLVVCAVLIGVAVTAALFVIEHARREVIAFHSAPDSARLASMELSTTSVVIINFQWATEDGLYWASWGLRERHVVDSPTRLIRGIPLH